MNVSATEILAWKQCKRKWMYSSSNCMALEPEETPQALTFGTGIHLALELYHSKDIYPEDTFSEWAEDNLPSNKKGEELLALGRGMLGHYRLSQPCDFQVIGTEIPFSVPIGVHRLVGRIDGLVRDNDNRLMILEHKTYAVAPPEDHLVLDLQTALYQWAINYEIRCGKIPGVPSASRVCGVIYNGLRKKVPAKPKKLKSGGVSKSLHQDTTLELFTKQLNKYGLDPAEYQDVIDHLTGKGNTFFRRIRHYRSVAEIAMTELDLLSTCEAMLQDHTGLEKCTASPSRDCSWMCSYQTLCHAQHNGTPVDDPCSVGFRRRKTREERERELFPTNVV